MRQTTMGLVNFPNETQNVFLQTVGDFGKKKKSPKPRRSPAKSPKRQLISELTEE